MIFKERKMKTRKNGTWVALAAVLLLTAVLVTNCIEPLVGTNDGKSYLKLDLGGGGNGRTIMPTTALAPFVQGYTVEISGTSYTHSTLYNNVAALTGTTFTVPSGSRTITVRAYTIHEDHPSYSSGTTTYTAEGTATLNVIAGVTNTQAIHLAPVSGGGNGTFTWNLTYDGDDFSGLTSTAAATATMVVNGVTYDLNGDDTEDTGSEPLAAGTYDVTVTIGSDIPSGTTGAKKTAIYHDVLHIYEGMVSDYTKDFNELLGDAFVVTFNNYNGTGNTGLTYAHAAVLNSHGNWATISGATYSGYNLDGWFKDSVFSDEITVASFPVYRDETLYAKWSVATPGDLDITFSLTDWGYGLDVDSPNGFSVSIDNLTKAILPTVITLTFDEDTIPPDATYTSHLWKYNEVTTNGGTFVFSAATPAHVNEGKHIITLEVTFNGSNRFTKDFEIIVTN